MRPGSIVVVKPVPVGIFAPCIEWTPVQDEKTPYMIRAIRDYPDGSESSATFEEGLIGIGPSGLEIGIKLSYLREILPPEDISEQVEDMMCVPLSENL